MDECADGPLRADVASDHRLVEAVLQREDVAVRREERAELLHRALGEVSLDAEEGHAERAAQVVAMDGARVEEPVTTDAGDPQPALVDRPDVRGVTVHECDVVSGIGEERADRPADRARADNCDWYTVQVIRGHR